MNENYTLVEDHTHGISVFRMESKIFSFRNIYDVVGKNENVVTFIFKKDSNSFKVYGPTLTGIAHFSFHERQALDDGNERSSSKIKILGLDSNLSLNEKCDLKYEGVTLSDIEAIEFSRKKRPKSLDNNGIKEVPNVVSIELNSLDGNIDILNQNYLVSKFNRGVKLAKYEQEQLIGIQLALHDDNIDSRLLSMYGYEAETVLDDINVAFHYLSAKCRIGRISNEEKENLENIKVLIRSRRIIKIIEEIKLSKNSRINTYNYPIEELTREVTAFRPQILLHGTNQVYWDVDSYIHIMVRHIKDFQIGNFKNKTKLPYKHKDLSILMEKVLAPLREEIALHFEQKPDRDFVRSGSMAVRFNGDYFNLRINSVGRLYQFHSVSCI